MPMENHEDLYRRGLISSDKLRKLKVQRGAIQRGKMADFDDRGGKRDQGGIHDRGDTSVAGNRSIDSKQSRSSPIASPPSKGGSVAGGQNQPVRRNELNAGAQQKPDFPDGSKVPAPGFVASRPNVKASSQTGRSGKTAKKRLTNQTSGTVPKSGGQYGGGGQDTQ